QGRKASRLSWNRVEPQRTGKRRVAGALIMPQEKTGAVKSISKEGGRCCHRSGEIISAAGCDRAADRRIDARQAGAAVKRQPHAVSGGVQFAHFRGGKSAPEERDLVDIAVPVAPRGLRVLTDHHGLAVAVDGQRVKRAAFQSAVHVKILEGTVK